MISPALDGPAAAEAPAVDVRGLVKRYGSTAACDGLSFSVARGELVAVLGPNGAGKTTAVECVEGYRRPDSGTLRVLGLDPTREHRALTPRVGVMLQAGGVPVGLRPLEALRHHAAFHRRPHDPAALLERVGLGGVRTSFRGLSGGQQQRLKLALALVGRPELAVLDEPTSGVDPHGRAAVHDLLRELRATGTTVLLTTHDLDEAETLADRVVVVDAGQVVASGSPAELTQGEDAVSFTTRPSVLLDGLRARLPRGVTVEESPPGRYVLRGGDPGAVVAVVAVWAADAGVEVAGLGRDRQRLVDVVLRLTGGARSATSPGDHR